MTLFTRTPNPVGMRRSWYRAPALGRSVEKMILGAIIGLFALLFALPIRADEAILAKTSIHPPSTTNCAVATPGPRLRLLLSEDGRFYVEGIEFSADQLTAVAATISKIEPKARVYLRADRSVAIEHIKRAVKACGTGGMNNVIFGALADEDMETLNAAKKTENSTR